MGSLGACGGAAYIPLLASQACIAMIGSNTTHNLANHEGGAFWVAGGGNSSLLHLWILGSHLLHNQATFGGVVNIAHASSAVVNVESSVLNSNQAVVSGGAMRVARVGHVDILITSNSSVVANKAAYGGAFSTEDTIVGTFLISGHSRALDNEALLNATLEGSGSGGVLHVGTDEKLQNFTITDHSSCVNNSATECGGALATYSLGALMVSDNSSLSLNSALLILPSDGSVDARGTYGGAVSTQVLGDVMVLSGSRMDGNTAGKGGAVNAAVIWDGNLTVTDSSSISENGALDRNGGVINVGNEQLNTPASHANITVVGNSVVGFNHASQSGGVLFGPIAIDVLLVSGSSLVVENKALAGAGGVLSSTLGMGSFVIEDGSAVDSNTAALFGGGVLCMMTPASDPPIPPASIDALELRNGSSLSNNQVTGSPESDPSLAQGGAVYALSIARLELQGASRMDGNRASGSCGALYLEDGILDTFIVGSGSSVSGNVAESGRGGVICATHQWGILPRGTAYTPTKVSIAGGSHMDQNAAMTGGGAIYVEGSLGVLEVSGNSTLDQNTAMVGHGGAAYVNGSLDTVFVRMGSSISDNGAGTIRDPTGNFLAANGGALFVSGIVGQSMALGAVEIDGGSRMDGNYAGQDGGAIHTVMIDSLVLSGGSTMDLNVAYAGLHGGGAVFITGRALPSWGRQRRGSRHFFSITNGSRASGNSCGRCNGGVVSVLGCEYIDIVVDDHASISRNTAVSGGAVFLDQCAFGQVSITGGSSVTNNSAVADGGAFASGLSDMRIFVPGISHIGAILVGGDSSVNGNTAGSRGGAVFLSSWAAAGDIVVSASSVVGNKATRGGVVHVDGMPSAADLAMTAGLSYRLVRLTNGTNVSHNTADVGGVLYVGNQQANNQPTTDLMGTVTVEVSDGGLVMENVARDGSGGIAHVDVLLDVVVTSGGQVMQNLAASDGGAFWAVEASSVVVSGSGSVLGGNEAQGRGGAMFVQGRLGTLQLDNESTVQDNVALRDGGAFYALEAINVVCDHAHLHSNSARAGNGGFVHFENVVAGANITNSVVANNSAGGSGGAVSVIAPGAAATTVPTSSSAELVSAPHTCRRTHAVAHMPPHTCLRTHAAAHMPRHTCRPAHMPPHTSLNGSV